MHTEALPGASGKLLASLKAHGGSELCGWVLAGGTGLALQLGHRVSEDFDFFRTHGMETRSLFDRLREMATCNTLYSDERTLSVLLRGVKLSFFQVRDPFLFPVTPYTFFGVADIRDIALMKLLAVTNRGSRKDFVDLFAILQSGPTLSDYLQLLPRKYGPGRLNPYQVAMSLTYFDDAEAEPLPRMLAPFEWSPCKQFFIREVRALVLP
jgi:hypothetical protein